MQRRVRITVPLFCFVLMASVGILSCLFMAFGANAQERNLPGTREGEEQILTLFFAANPRYTQKLRLDHELRAIEDKIEVGKYHDLIELRSEWAVRRDDLIKYLNKYKPHIVHFSGHGTETTGEIILEDNTGAPETVSTEEMRALFKTLKGNIRLVVLNACYSKKQAEAIVENIDCAVGMSSEIKDSSAIEFVSSFYRALAFGVSVWEAFEQGKLGINA